MERTPDSSRLVSTLSQQLIDLDLKMDYRLVGDKIMINLTTYLKVKRRGLTGLAMNQRSLKVSVVSFRRVFGDDHQADFHFTAAPQKSHIR